jgi:hypothetical protein
VSEYTDDRKAVSGKNKNERKDCMKRRDENAAAIYCK